MSKIQILAVLHLVGASLGLIIGGVILPTVYYWVTRSDFKNEERQVFWDLFNFQLSFGIYFALGILLSFYLAGIIALVVFLGLYLVNLIGSFIYNLRAKRFNYLLTLRFF
jgi:hypothetical protein